MKISLKTAIIILSLALFINAQENSYLKDLRDKFNSINSLSANLVQLTDGKVNLEGKFLFKKENKLKLELKNFMIVSDGVTNWNYNRKQKKVIISNYDENDPSAISLKKIIFDYPSKCAVSETKNSGIPVIELKPEANSGINAQSIKIWMNGDNLVQKVLIKSNTGSELEFRFSGYKINPGLPDSEFSFTPPEGIKIIDIR